MESDTNITEDITPNITPPPSWSRLNFYFDFVPQSNATSIHLVSHHIQVLLISVIILVCVLANLLIISNIINCDIKSRIISFQLIKYLCFVDLIGACTVLPIPLAATIQGHWSLGPHLCYINSFITMVIWMEHMIMFAMLKVDKMLISMLPVGKYPLISMSVTKILVLVSWLVSALVSFNINTFCDVVYEPAVLLCVPSFPKEVFIVAASIMTSLVILIIISFIGGFIYVKKKQSRVQDVHTETTEHPRNYKSLEKSLCSNFFLTMFHIILYLPTVLVVGLHGWILPPFLILICDLFVYAEFMIHPVILLTTSGKLRREITASISSKYTGLKLGLKYLFCCLCCNFQEEEEEDDGLPKKSNPSSSGNIHVIQLKKSSAIERRITVMCPSSGGLGLATRDQGTMTNFFNVAEMGSSPPDTQETRTRTPSRQQADTTRGDSLEAKKG